jgi:hypothetical protein
MRVFYADWTFERLRVDIDAYPFVDNGYLKRER